MAPSDPNIIYVGSGEGIIRPDGTIGDGMYKSTDAGKTWTHLGLRDTQKISQVIVDPHNPDRLFVAAIGHPYGPNPERGIFRSTDGGKTFQKVLYKDEYTSGEDVDFDPSNPQIVYATLWQQQAPWENGSFEGTSGGLFKSTDGGSTWKPIGTGLPEVIQMALAVAPGNPQRLYASVASEDKVTRSASIVPMTAARAGPKPPMTSGPPRASVAAICRHWRWTRRIPMSSTATRRCCGNPPTRARPGFRLRVQSR